jgi:serine/threonine-protein kinase
MGDQGMTMTQTSAVIGTAQYLSPEQAKGETVDARSDLYSTGCLLYELLTGRPPFVGDSPVAVAYQHVREAPLPPSHHDPEVPAVADAIVLKSLGKHPDERYQSADEMRADIERALDGRPIAAAPTLMAGYGAANAPTQVVSSAAGYGGGQTTAGYGPPTRYQPTQYQPSFEDARPEDGVRRRGDTAGGGGGRNKKSDKTGYIILAVVAVIAVVLAVVVFNKLLGSNGSSGGTTAVPPITGKTVAQAQQVLSANGLKLGSNTCTGDAANSDTVPAGQIISQNPQSGASVQSNSTVSYCLSAGAQQKTLPSTQALNTNTKDKVEQTLHSNGFNNLVDQSQASSTVPAGNVIDLQDGNGKSLAGQTVPLTTAITVVVSSGPGNATVPPVLGQSCTQALQTVQGAGFQTQQVMQYSNDVQSGNAIGTDPGANAQAGKGSTVKVFCSNGPSPAPSASSTPSPSASASGGGGLLGGGGGNGGNG